tara:strand:- start:1002 stop:1607 length:606 start_codon:yes stop_codon:yes gene_type:complete
MGNKKRSPFYDNSLLLLGITLCLWVITIIDQNTPNWNLTLNYGIKPKILSGILGIFTAPLIHINYSHLIGNTLPFMALAGMVLMNGRRKFIFTSIFSALFAGIGIWVFGAAGSIHTGSSTLIFSYLGFLLIQAWLVRSILTGFLAILSISLYGTLLLTLLINQDGISWHGHLFGLLGGLISAILITSSPAKKKRTAIVKID